MLQPPLPVSLPKFPILSASGLLHSGSRALSLMALLLMLHGSTPACADSAFNDWTDLSNSISPEQLSSYLSAEDFKLLQELEKAQQHKGAKSKVSPAAVTGPNQVRYVYGASVPTLVCALLHISDITLEPGEEIMDVLIGDSARWLVSRSLSGTPDGQLIEHVNIKPTDVGLETNMRILTSRRSYDINLKSTAEKFMPSISFLYPENSLARFSQLKAQLQGKKQAQSMRFSSQQMDMTSLDFNYELDGDEELYPLRVFNDGHKTYIQMPERLGATGNRMPALVAVSTVNSDPSLWSNSADTGVINYRISGNNFVVDGLPSHLRLLFGNSAASGHLSADIIYQSASR